MRTPLLLVLSMTLLASCTIGASRWTTAGAHVVDGYWLAEETPCPRPGDNGSECVAAVRVALAGLMAEEPGAVIVGKWTAHPTYEWLDAEGQQRMLISSGVGGEVAVVLDLVGGRRRVIGVMCPLRGDGPVGPECYLDPDGVSAFRFGEEPWK